jgi:hypothetical protein
MEEVISSYTKNPSPIPPNPASILHYKNGRKKWIPQSLVVEDAQPTKIFMTGSVAETKLIASDFTIEGFIVSSISRDATNKILTLTLNIAVVYGNVLSVILKGISYQVTNNVVYTPQDFLAANSASANVTALNNAVTNYRYVKIKTPGVYQINNTIWIPSDTKLEFCAGCTIKKATGSIFTFMFANKGILTYERNQNITVLGNGSIIDQNNVDTRTQGVPYHMVGLLNFFHVDNLLLDGFSQTGGNTLQFFGHVGDLSNFVIRNMNVETKKAVFQFQGKCFDGLIEDITADSFDDDLAFNAIDYPIVMASVGNIERITVRRWTSNEIVNAAFANGCRIMTGSWANWATGTTYNLNDLCVSGGNIYVKSSAGAQVSSVAPTHLNGKVTGADSIEWWWLQQGTETVACVKDITFEDIHINAGKPCIALIHENSVNMRSIFPGTEGNGYVDNLVLDNVSYNPPVDLNTNLFYARGFVKKVTIKNSTITPVNDCNLIDADAALAGTYNGYIDEVEIDNCNITLNASSWLFTKTNATAGQKVNILNSTINLSNTVVLNYKQANAERLATITLSNSIFNGIQRLTEYSFCHNMNWIATNCQFNDVWNLILRATNVGAGITFTSDGCTYSTPRGSYLFDNSIDTKFTINITNSSGVVSRSKIAKDVIVITACDLYQHLFTIGESIYGGKVVNISANRLNIIIVANNDLSNAVWGCSGVDITGTLGHVGDGQHDTNLVLAGCATAGIAARLCDEYNDGTYSDWYLPSNDEMSLCYTHRAVLGSFQNAQYNTSRNMSASNCYVINPVTGAGASVVKTTSRPVRPFRSVAMPD